MRKPFDSVLTRCNNKGFTILNSQVKLTVYNVITLCAMHGLHKILRCCSSKAIRLRVYEELRSFLEIKKNYSKNKERVFNINLFNDTLPLSQVIANICQQPLLSPLKH